MMAGYKKHVGLYPHPSVIEHFVDDLKDYNPFSAHMKMPIRAFICQALPLEANTRGESCQASRAVVSGAMLVCLDTGE